MTNLVNLTDGELRLLADLRSRPHWWSACDGEALDVRPLVEALASEVLALRRRLRQLSPASGQGVET